MHSEVLILLWRLSLAYPILYFGFFFSHLYFGFVVQCLWDTEVYCLAVWSLMVRRWLRHIQSVINSMFDVNHMEYAVSNLNKQKKIDTCREAIMPTAFVLQLRVVSHWFISVNNRLAVDNGPLCTNGLLIAGASGCHIPHSPNGPARHESSPFLILQYFVLFSITFFFTIFCHYFS
jgi:hypothetical protein